MDHQKWLKDTFIKQTPSESLFAFVKLQFTEPTKFEQLSELLSNIFYTESNLEAILNIFCSIQKTAHAMSRLKYMYRFNKSRVYNTEDLYMNPISIHSRGTLTLLQNDTKYVFHIRELIHTVNSSLSHCCHFFADPIVCKNPYTNLPFTKSALYTIYFAIKGSSFLMPTLFHRYFLSNFDYGMFCIENGQLINEEYLNTYVENYCLDNVYFHVREMFEDHHMKCHIHKTFPKDQLFEIMKPYLKLYFASNFLINRHKKQNSFNLLHKKIHAFINFNPHFGKRKVKMIPLKPFSQVKKCNYYFEDTVVPFSTNVDNKKSNSTFLTSHLDECDEVIEESSASSYSSYEEEAELDFDTQQIVNNRTPTPILYDEDGSDDEGDSTDDGEDDEIRLPVIEDSEDDD